MKQKKAIVYFSAGLGDAVLLIPLVRSLKERGFVVTGLFNSKHPCEEIFIHTRLLDNIVVCKSKTKQVLFSLSHLFSFDEAFINYFAANRSNFLTALLLAKEIHLNRKINSAFEKIFRSRIKFNEPLKNVHDADQNMHLTGKQVPKLAMQDFYIDLDPVKMPNLPHSFTVLQISAGNNKISYKNWPVKHWINFLKIILQHYPDKKFVLLGDINETGLAEKLVHEFPSQLLSLAGKTNIKEAMNILALSDLFIGLDGGLMHLAAALKKPTFTIWGPSNTNLYGYETIDPAMHKCVHLDLECRPCSAWINANHSRVTDPELCPDHACMQQLDPAEVYQQFSQFLYRLQHAW